ncbi:MAG: prolipoprotein diacylglyceryl transferase [Candidatus Aquicultorales bacterium]
MKPVLFKLGPVSINSWGILVALGVIAGLLVARKRAKEIGLAYEHVLDLTLYLMVGGLLGARLLYLTFYPSIFLNDPMEIFSVWQGGMSIHGGVIGGLLAGLIFVRRRGLAFWRLADLTAPSLILGQAIGRIGCFLNGDSYGLTTSVPWAVKFPALPGLRHPTQLYEAVLDIGAFFLLWSRREKTKFEGELFLYYVVAYSFIRGVVEFFRASPKVLGPISPAQIASVVAIAVALALIAMARLRVRSLQAKTP